MLLHLELVVATPVVKYRRGKRNKKTGGGGISRNKREEIIGNTPR